MSLLSKKITLPMEAKLFIILVLVGVLSFVGYALIKNSKFSGILKSDRLTLEECMEAQSLAEQGVLGLSAHDQLSGVGVVTEKNSQYAGNNDYRPAYILDMGEQGIYNLADKPKIHLTNASTKVQTTVQQCPGITGESYQVVYVISMERIE